MPASTEVASILRDGASRFLRMRSEIVSQALRMRSVGVAADWFHQSILQLAML
jgi:hypothetical protein